MACNTPSKHETGAGQYPSSPSQHYMLARACVHSEWRAAADSEMEVSSHFTSVHIPSLGRAVTGNASDSEMEVSAYFTSVHIYRLFWKGCDRHCYRQRNGSICLFHKCESDASKKEVYAWFTSEPIRPFGNAVTRRSEIMGHTDSQNATDITERTEVKQHSYCLCLHKYRYVAHF